MILTRPGYHLIRYVPDSLLDVIPPDTSRTDVLNHGLHENIPLRLNLLCNSGTGQIVICPGAILLRLLAATVRYCDCKRIHRVLQNPLRLGGRIRYLRAITQTPSRSIFDEEILPQININAIIGCCPRASGISCTRSRGVRI